MRRMRFSLRGTVVGKKMLAPLEKNYVVHIRNSK